jgi:hypothetical protein
MHFLKTKLTSSRILLRNYRFIEFISSFTPCSSHTFIVTFFCSSLAPLFPLFNQVTSNYQFYPMLNILFFSSYSFALLETVGTFSKLKNLQFATLFKHTGLFTREVFLNFFLPQPIIHIATIS